MGLRFFPSSCFVLIMLLLTAALARCGCGEEGPGGEDADADIAGEAPDQDAGPELVDFTEDQDTPEEDSLDAADEDAGEDPAADDGVTGDALDWEDDETAPPPGPWRVEHGALIDPTNRRVTLRGVNMAGSHKNEGSSGYLGLDDEGFYRLFADAGLNVLRFLVTWAAVMPEEGVIDEEYLDGLEERMDWAEEAGLLVFIDMHQDIYGEGFVINGHTIGDGAPFWSCPNDHVLTREQSDWFLYYLDPKVVECFDHFWDDETTQDYFVQAWTAVAERAAAHDNVIGIDPLNEAHWGSLWRMAVYETMYLVPLYERVVTAARAIKPDLIAFIEPGAIKNVTGRTAIASLPFNDVVYAPHMYNAAMETGGAYDPGLHYSAFEDKVGRNLEEAAALEAAPMVGEWGIGTSDDENLGLFLHDIVPLLDINGLGWTYWEAGPGSGYAIASTLRELRAGAEWMIVPFPERVNGEDVNWSYDYDTASLILTFTAGERRAVPTLIAVPVDFGMADVVMQTNVREVVDVDGGIELYFNAAGEMTDIQLQW